MLRLCLPPVPSEPASERANRDNQATGAAWTNQADTGTMRRGQRVSNEAPVELLSPNLHFAHGPQEREAERQIEQEVAALGEDGGR